MAPPEKHSLKHNKFTTTTIRRRSKRLQQKMNTCTAAKTTTSKRVPNAKRIKATASNLEINSTLTTINEDCFRHIVQYLSIVHIVNLAASCPRLQYFIENVIYPKKAKVLCVDTSCRSRSDTALTATLFAPLENKKSPKLKMKSLETSFSHFGEFVEDLTFQLIPWASCGIRKVKSKIWRSFENMIAHCRELTTLRFRKYEFRQADIFVLQMIIEKMPSLQQLDFRGCSGLTNNWRSMSFESISRVHKITVSTRNDISGHFFEHFTNLSSLTINVCGKVWHPADLEQIFNITGNNLKQLTIICLHLMNGYETVGTLITDRLTKLENLQLEIQLNENTRYMTELPHLMALKVGCNHHSINAMMRTLSAKGIIRKMVIYDGNFEYEDTNAVPLIFSKLQFLVCENIANMSSFFQALIKYQMPVFKTFILMYTSSSDYELLNFIDSKKTLKRIVLYSVVLESLLPFFRQLIDILRKPCTPKRPVLQFIIGPVQIGAEEMELLQRNRHLLKVMPILC